MSTEVPDAVSGLLAGLGPDARVAGYRLDQRIGAGGMAVVFLATDERLGRRVALKVLAPALASDQAFRQRFVREARAAAAVDDPHIIPVYEAGESGGVLFIAMRYVPGGDVRTLLHERGPMAAVRAASIISPIASALDSAHAAGLIHRDVKPANMLIDVRSDRPDHVYLSDFGLTKGAASAGPTGTGQFLGTPNYMAPEQIRGDPVDGRVDQYALACAAFEMLTGQPPFERDQGMAVLLAHLNEPAPAASARRADLPSAVDLVFARALAKAPADRYPTCRAFADSLREANGLAPYYSGPAAIPVSDHPPLDLAPDTSWVPTKKAAFTDKAELVPDAHRASLARTRTTAQVRSDAATYDARVKPRPPSARGLPWKISAAAASAALVVTVAYFADHSGGHHPAPASSTGSAPARHGPANPPVFSSWKFSGVDAGNGLLSVSCPTRNFCAASDSNGEVSLYHGAHWSDPHYIDRSGGYMNSISCAVATGSVFCAAVDDYGNVTAYNGRAWSRLNDIDPNGEGLLRVSCATISFCVAVDADGSAFAYDGANWSQQGDIDGTGGKLWAVSCLKTGFCAAFDLAGYTLSFRNSAWITPVHVDVSGNLAGGTISCASPRFCMISDNLGNMTAFNGNTWSRPARCGYRSSVFLGFLDCVPPFAETAVLIRVDHPLSGVIKLPSSHVLQLHDLLRAG